LTLPGFHVHQKWLYNVFDERRSIMGNKGPVQYRQYTDEFRVEAVRLSESVGVSTAAKRLGIPDGSLRNWVKRGRTGQFVTSERPSATPVKRSLADVEAENSRLRRELESARLDLEIVKKAAAYFAKESR
jgi:transposase